MRPSAWAHRVPLGAGVAASGKWALQRLRGFFAAGVVGVAVQPTGDAGEARTALDQQGAALVSLQFQRLGQQDQIGLSVLIQDQTNAKICKCMHLEDLDQ